MGYDEWVGLELNADDIEMRRTWFAFLAHTYALNPSSPIPAAWFDAVTDSPEEAAQLEYRTNSRRR